MDTIFVLKILLALFIGGLIGAEREYKNKSAGLRTMIIICVASTLFTMLSISIGGVRNPDRIASNILTGLGFLGAGVIFKDDNRITGLTTATTIWVVAALGMAIGSGHYIWAIGTTAAILIVLLAFLYLQVLIDKRHQIRHYRIVLPYQPGLVQSYERLFRKHKLEARRMKQLKKEELFESCWVVSGTGHKHETVINLILSDPLIKEFEF
jgi:putative Mg2+ transporter-C (MgtC) family protein